MGFAGAGEVSTEKLTEMAEMLEMVEVIVVGVGEMGEAEATELHYIAAKVKCIALWIWKVKVKFEWRGAHRCR